MSRKAYKTHSCKPIPAWPQQGVTSNFERKDSERRPQITGPQPNAKRRYRHRHVTPYTYRTSIVWKHPLPRLLTWSSFPRTLANAPVSISRASIPKKRVATAFWTPRKGATKRIPVVVYLRFNTFWHVNHDSVDLLWLWKTYEDNTPRRIYGIWGWKNRTIRSFFSVFLVCPRFTFPKLSSRRPLKIWMTYCFPMR